MKEIITGGRTFYFWPFSGRVTYDKAGKKGIKPDDLGEQEREEVLNFVRYHT